MKSIKEKAEEYSHTKGNLNEYYDSAGEWLDFDPIGYTQRTFEAGANYVINEIEEFMLHNLVHSGSIKRLIEQLKK